VLEHGFDFRKDIGMRIFCVDWDIMDHTKILTL
jgi:hypothetical protein